MVNPIDPTGALSAPAPEGMIDHFRSRPSHTPSIAVCEKLFEELKKYLFIIAVARSRKPGVRHSPSLAIDAMWHCFMTYDTEAYTRYCDKYLGGYVHHKTGGFYAEAPIREIMLEFGITPDTEIWSDGDGDCG